MQVMNCQKCGAECPPGTSFCRRCGAPVDTGAIRASEQTTALLEQNDGVTTQRLESRATGPEYGRLPRPVEAGKSSSNRRALLIAALVVVVVCVIGVVGFKALQSHGSASMTQFLYPGAKTLLDVRTDDGGRALQLETSDSFDDVEAWYQKTLNTQKIVRLTPTNVVLKNEKALITIAGDGNKTHVVIKTFK